MIATSSEPQAEWRDKINRSEGEADANRSFAPGTTSDAVLTQSKELAQQVDELRVVPLVLRGSATSSSVLEATPFSKAVPRRERRADIEPPGSGMRERKRGGVGGSQRLLDRS